MSADPPSARRVGTEVGRPDDNHDINRRNAIGLGIFVAGGLLISATLFMFSSRGPWADPCSAALLERATAAGEAGLGGFLARCSSGPQSIEAGRRLDEQRRARARAKEDDAAYQAAAGSIERLESYAKSCDVCRHREAALSEAAKLREAQRSAQLAKLPGWWKVCADGRASADRQIEACTAIIESIAETRGNRGIAYANRGNAWYAKRDYDRALADYNEGIKLNPIPNAHSGRGNVWHVKRDYDRAIADYNEAIRLNPRHSVAYHNRANSWQAKGDFDRAISDHGEAIRLNPKYYLAYRGRGNAWYAKDDFDRAISDYDEAIRLNPKDAVAYNNRGNAWRSKGDLHRALADYDEAIRLNPKYAFAYNNRGVVWRAGGDFDRAIADYSEAIRLNPKYALAYYNRGIAWAAKSDHDRALADYNDAIRLNPKYADAYYNRGLAWRVRGDTERAIADFREALALGQERARAELRELGVEL